MDANDARAKPRRPPPQSSGNLATPLGTPGIFPVLGGLTALLVRRAAELVPNSASGLSSIEFLRDRLVKFRHCRVSRVHPSLHLVWEAVRCGFLDCGFLLSGFRGDLRVPPSPGFTELFQLREHPEQIVGYPPLPPAIASTAVPDRDLRL